MSRNVKHTLGKFLAVKLALVSVGFIGAPVTALEPEPNSEAPIRDRLNADTGELEAKQFSTPTKLAGEVIF